MLVEQIFRKLWLSFVQGSVGILVDNLPSVMGDEAVRWSICSATGEAMFQRLPLNFQVSITLWCLLRYDAAFLLQTALIPINSSFVLVLFCKPTCSVDIWKISWGFCVAVFCVDLGCVEVCALCEPVLCEMVLCVSQCCVWYSIVC